MGQVLFAKAAASYPSIGPYRRRVQNFATFSADCTDTPSKLKCCYEEELQVVPLAHLYFFVSGFAQEKLSDQRKNSYASPIVNNSAAHCGMLRKVLDFR